MGPQTQITIVDREDLGPVLARADHELNQIEVNKACFYKLPPMVQEFVLCHEVCHLAHNEWDEQRTQQLAADLFLSRAANPADRETRERFLSYLDGNGGYSNFAWGALLSAVASLGMSVYGIIRDRNAGWYSWTEEVQRSNMSVMLNNAFEQSRRSSSQSAADYLWQQLQPYTNKDDSLDDFLGRSDNAWVNTEISKYEAKYGFGLREVTPIDLTAYPLAIVAIGALVGYIVYKIIKNRKK